MRTNRVGNLKRFFHIADTDVVWDVSSEHVSDLSYGAAYDYIFWNPIAAQDEAFSMQKLFDRLKENGKLVVFFDNPHSIHAFAQGKADTMGKGIGYSFLSEQLKELSKNRELYHRWYYPYPSVEFPVTFFSDKRLPGSRECDDNFYNFDYVCMEVFIECEVTDRVVSDGMYRYLAHAYMLVVSPQPLNDFPNYTRFSNERRMDLQIRTDLYDSYVSKRAVTGEAGAHVLKMKRLSAALEECLEGITLFGKECTVNEITDVNQEEGELHFSYVKGKSLEQKLDDMQKVGRTAEVAEVLLSFCNSLKESKKLMPFEASDAFTEIFGEIGETQQYGWKTFGVTDIDLVPQNILLSEKAVVIDYEWTFDFPVPVEFLVFRFLYFYLEAKNRELGETEMFCDLYEKVGITEELKDIFLSMETNFQHYVQQGAKVLCNSFDVEGKPVLTSKELAAQLSALEGRDIALVSPEGERKCIHASRSQEGTYVYKLPAKPTEFCVELTGFDTSGEKTGAKVLRIGAMADRHGTHVGLSAASNGMHLGGLLYLYENELPQLTVKGKTGEDIEAEISVEEIAMSEAAIREIKMTISDMKFIIDNREQQIRDLKNSASWKVTKPLRMLKGNKEE